MFKVGDLIETKTDEIFSDSITPGKKYKVEKPHQYGTGDFVYIRNDRGALVGWYYWRFKLANNFDSSTSDEHLAAQYRALRDETKKLHREKLKIHRALRERGYKMKHVGDNLKFIKTETITTTKEI